MRIAHVINPFRAHPSSDLFVAQPITFETMRREAATTEGVELYASLFEGEEQLLPPGFSPTAALARSIRDDCAKRGCRRLPYLKDILDGLFEASSAEYLVYSNVDIALFEGFYRRVFELIDAGLDAFSITRRTLCGGVFGVEDIPELQREEGTPHPGWDCFVFRRDLYPRFCLDGVAIGLPPFCMVLLSNSKLLASHFQAVTDERLTFHIGNDGTWKRYLSGPPCEEQLVTVRNSISALEHLLASVSDPRREVAMEVVQTVELMEGYLARLEYLDSFYYRHIRYPLGRVRRVVRGWMGNHG